MSINKEEIGYNIATLLKIIDGDVFISGVKFENLNPVGKTIKYNLQLNELSFNEIIIEKLIPLGNEFYAKYFNTIYDLKNDLSASNQKRLSDGERISDITVSNEKLIVMTNITGGNKLYFLLPDLSIDFKETLDNFEVNEMEDLSILGNYVIIHHDSKSIKIKIYKN